MNSRGLGVLLTRVAVIMNATTKTIVMFADMRNRGVEKMRL
jgi:hypothetical protein